VETAGLEPTQKLIGLARTEALASTFSGLAERCPKPALIYRFLENLMASFSK
jgi:hypothetical protein